MAQKVCCEVDDDVRILIYAACLIDYCYRQGYCTSKCLMQRHCTMVTNSMGIEDGEFQRWSLPDLIKGMQLTHSQAIIKHDKQEHIVDVNK